MRQISGQFFNNVSDFETKFFKSITFESNFQLSVRVRITFFTRQLSFFFEIFFEKPGFAKIGFIQKSQLESICLWKRQILRLLCFFKIEDSGANIFDRITFLFKIIRKCQTLN